jgi:hypothetical protein
VKRDPDAVHHTDLPVTGCKPRRLNVRVLEIVDRDPQMDDPLIEAVAFIRRVPVFVYDFYRFRP